MDRKHGIVEECHATERHYPAPDLSCPHFQLKPHTHRVAQKCHERSRLREGLRGSFRKVGLSSFQHWEIAGGNEVFALDVFDMRRVIGIATRRALQCCATERVGFVELARIQYPFPGFRLLGDALPNPRQRI